VCLVRIGAQQHCNACGHQWGELPKVHHGPTRGEYLAKTR
jgi:hypothetical protein